MGAYGFIDATCAGHAERYGTLHDTCNNIMKNRCEYINAQPTHRPSAESELDGVQVRDGTPHLSNQTLLGDVDVAQVERVVDGLHLPHLDEPHPHGLGGGLQHSLTVVLCLVQHLQTQGGAIYLRV